LETNNLGWLSIGIGFIGFVFGVVVVSSVLDVVVAVVVDVVSASVSVVVVVVGVVISMLSFEASLGVPDAGNPSYEALRLCVLSIVLSIDEKDLAPCTDFKNQKVPNQKMSRHGHDGTVHCVALRSNGHVVRAGQSSSTRPAPAM
jgi:hypothetical protein